MTRPVPDSLVDSSSLLHDYAGLRSRIDSDGYLFVRRLLDPDLVRTVGRTGLSYLQQAGWTRSGGSPEAASPNEPVRAIRMRDAFTDNGYRRIIADPGFNYIPFATPLAYLMGQILGPAGFCYPLKIPRVVYPVSLVRRQPGNIIHKDYGAVQDMFTCWVPLGDVPRTLGGLAVRPGSQRSANVAHRPLDRLEEDWLTADYEAGDVLIFHCLTTHAALPNRQARMRFSAEYRWQLADQPAPRHLVIGPNGREIGSRLFRTSPWWRPVPTGLTLFDGGGFDAVPRLPVPASRFVGITSSSGGHTPLRR